MKIKMLALSICMFATVALSGCHQKEDYIIGDDEVKVVEADSVPCSLQIDDYTLELSKVEVYRQRCGSGINYRPYVFATIDTSSLSEAEILSITEDSKLYVSCSYSSSQNEVDHKSMSNIEMYNTGSELIYILGDYPNEYPHNFSDITLTLTIMTRQEETFEYINDEGELEVDNKLYVYPISLNLSQCTTGNIMDTSDLPDEQLEMLIEGLIKDENYEYDSYEYGYDEYGGYYRIN